MHLCPGEHLSSGDHVYQVDNLQRTLAATATRETPDSIREKEFPYSASHLSLIHISEPTRPY